MAELRRRAGGGDGDGGGTAFGHMTADEIDALIAAQAEAFGSSDDGGDSDSDGPDSESEDGAPRVPWALKDPALLLSWASIVALFALQPAGRRVPQTMDLAVTAVRTSAAVAAALARRSRGAANA